MGYKITTLLRSCVAGQKGKQRDSPVDLELRVEGQQPCCQRSGVTVHKVAIAQHCQQPLTVILAKPVVKDGGEPQLEA